MTDQTTTGPRGAEGFRGAEGVVLDPEDAAALLRWVRAETRSIDTARRRRPIMWAVAAVTALLIFGGYIYG